MSIMCITCNGGHGPISPPNDEYNTGITKGNDGNRNNQTYK